MMEAKTDKNAVSIKKGLFLSGIIVTIIISLSFFTLHYHNASVSVERITSASIVQVTESIKEAFEAEVAEELKDDFWYILASSNFHSYFSSSQLDKNLYKINLEREMIELQKSHAWLLEEISIIDTGGNELIGISGKFRIREFRKIDDFGKDVKAVSEDIFQISDLSEHLVVEHTPKAEIPQFYCLKGFNDPETGTISGVILIKFKLDKFISYLGTLNTAEFKVSYGFAGKEFFPDSKPLLLPLFGRSDFLQIIIDPRREFSRKELLSQLIWYFVFALFIMLVICSIGRIAITKKIAIILSPLKDLSDSAKKIASGSSGSKLSLSRYSEINELIKEFNIMSISLAETTVSKNYVSNIIKSMMEMLIVLEPDGTIRNINQAVERVLGYPEKDLIGEKFSLIIEEGKEEEDTLISRLEKKGLIGQVEKTLLTKDGRKITVLFSGSVMRNNEDKVAGIVCVARDITEIKNAEKEKVDLQAQIAHAGKLAALGTMSAGIAHELNNPLAIIKGFNEMIIATIEKEGINNPKIQDCSEKIDYASERMKVIINHIREFSRDADKQERQQINPNEIVNYAMILLGTQLKNGNIKIDLVLNDELPKFWVNTNKMESVLQNLITNARDSFDNYTPNGEKFIKITTQVMDEDRMIAFNVEDNGKGIPEKNLRNIFDPFFTTKDIGKGTGLGLSLIHGIVSEHGGEIKVESQLNKGTIFSVKIPVDLRSEQKNKQGEK